MNAQQIDDQIKSMLASLQFFSRLGTCLGVRLSDYAAQMNGCRSTRQIDDSRADDVEDTYNQLLTALNTNAQECIQYLNEDHSYKEEIYLYDECLLERLLEDVLFEMTIYDCSLIFKNKLFD